MMSLFKILFTFSCLVIGYLRWMYVSFFTYLYAATLLLVSIFGVLM